MVFNGGSSSTSIQAPSPSQAPPPITPETTAPSQKASTMELQSSNIATVPSASAGTAISTIPTSTPLTGNGNSGQAASTTSDGLPFAISQPSTLPTSVLASIGGFQVSTHSTNVIIGSQTLSPGSVITVNETPVSLAPSGTSLFIGGTATFSSPIPFPTGGVTVPLPSYSGPPITENSVSAFFVGSQSLVPGGPAITVSGAVFSLASLATALVIGTSTIPLNQPTPYSVPDIITLDGFSVTADSQSDFLIGTQTLVPGGTAITVSGNVISLASDLGVVVIGLSTETLAEPTLVPGVPVITVGGSAITEDSLSDFVVGTQTLVPGGPAITVDGTPISLDASASALLVGTSVETLASSTPGLGGIIWSAFSEPAASSTGLGSTFTGGTSRVWTPSCCIIVVVELLLILGV